MNGHHRSHWRFLLDEEQSLTIPRFLPQGSTFLVHTQFQCEKAQEKGLCLEGLSSGVWENHHPCCVSDPLSHSLGLLQCRDTPSIQHGTAPRTAVRTC